MKKGPDPNSSALATCIAGPIRVTYRDTDRMGYAYHSTYLVWFEIGRTDLLRSLGTAYRSWEEDHGVYLPVRSADVQYKSPANYDDLVEVHTKLVKLTRASVLFTYEVRRHSTCEILATGSTAHAFVDSHGRVIRAADKLLPGFFA